MIQKNRRNRKVFEVPCSHKPPIAVATSPIRVVTVKNHLICLRDYYCEEGESAQFASSREAHRGPSRLEGNRQIGWKSMHTHMITNKEILKINKHPTCRKREG